MTLCFFVSDLHGNLSKYDKLFSAIEMESPSGVFIGGDILPGGSFYSKIPSPGEGDFLNAFLASRFGRLREKLGARYPEVFIILGNDDERVAEAGLLEGSTKGLWVYAHNRKSVFEAWQVYGYSYVPPTPFRLKDWERYDVSRYVDPGSISPEEGVRTVAVSKSEKRWSTIQKDLELLKAKDDLTDAVFLFHTPPYKTALDRAALDGQMIDHVPLDVHIGSIAVRRFIEKEQPLLTLHGHVHESTRLTGNWKDRIGRTWAFNAAHDGKELSIIKFDLCRPENAERILL